MENKGSNQFMTPPDLIERARKYFKGNINFDPATNLIAQRYVQADQVAFAPEDFRDEHIHVPVIHQDGLQSQWLGNVWCNPPYSAGLIDAFVDKAIEEYKSRNAHQILMLVNSQTDTRWYHKLLAHSSRVLLFKGRIKFWKMFDNDAHERWEGEKSKQEGLGKIGNSPRYLNSLFLLAPTGHWYNWDFRETFGDLGTIIHKEY